MFTRGVLVLSLAAIALTGCDRSASEAKPGTPAKSEPAKADATKADATKTEPAKAEPAKAEPTEPAAVPTPEPAVEAAAPADAPATTEQAAQQLFAWLEDPATAPKPPLLGAEASVELAVFCGPCTDDPPPTVTTLRGAEALSKHSQGMAEESAGGSWVLGGETKCEGDCCSYGPYEDEGSGQISLDKVCLTLDASGKPIAYTRIEASEH